MTGKGNNPVLRAEGLRKSFRSGDGSIRVLEGLDMRVLPAQTLSVRGESGSGKTTLLNLLAGLETPDDGQVWWQQFCLPLKGLAGLGARRADFIGIIFQVYHLLSELNVIENVLLAARVKGPIGRAEKQLAEELLAQVGLGSRLRSPVSVLSGGERQRVAVARALINQPKLILADEPTGNLDQRTGDAVMDMLLDICLVRETALVLVTHNAEYARRTHDALELKDGRLVAI